MNARHHRPLAAALPAVLGLAAVLAAARPAAASPGDRAALSPDRVRTLRHHPLTAPDGSTLRLADLAGEVVVVNFWATWCPPCRREMPLLDAMNARLAGDGARVVAISVDREPDHVRRFLAENGIDLPVFVDGPDGLAKSLDLAYLPYTVVLDRQGQAAFAGAASSETAWNRVNDLVARLTRNRPLRTAKEDSGS